MDRCIIHNVTILGDLYLNLESNGAFGDALYYLVKQIVLILGLYAGIVKMFDATPGDRYLVRTQDSMTRDGDLLYVGTWQQPEVRSLSGASSSGIPAPLIPQQWFPRDRAFVATAPQVRVLVYSEAPSTDFMISSLAIYRLQPAPPTLQRPGLE